jgi:hypothetical protein
MTPRQIGDHVEITQVLARYASAIDRRDFDLLREVFTPDASIDYAVEGGTKLSLPEMIEWLRGALRMFRVTQHALAMPIIDLDGDSARSVTYVTATHVQSPLDGSGDVYAVLHGAYTDRLVRTAAGWRIAERRLDNWYTRGDFLAPADARSFAVPELRESR